MERERFLNTAYLMLRLIARAVGIADSDVPGIDEAALSDLYDAAQKHAVCSLVNSGLQKQGVVSSAFTYADARAKRRAVLCDREISIICNKLESAQIRYLLLKGAAIKELYPEIGMREMSDIDILIDKSSADKVRGIMLDAGYTNTVYDRNHHEVYKKAPMFTFEMHRMLFDEEESFPQITRYYAQKDFLASDSTAYRCEMSRENAYIYLLAHMYQHYKTTGIGIRPFVDICLFVRAYGAAFDATYIREQLRQLGLIEYEASVRRMSQRMWNPDELSDEDRALLDYYLCSGIHGSKKQYMSNRVNNAVNGAESISKAEYIKRRFSMSDKEMECSPFLSRHPRLVPLKRCSQLLKAVFTKPKAILYELSELRKADSKSEDSVP